MYRVVFLILLSISFLPVSCLAEDRPLIIANADVPVSQIERFEVREIYLGKRRRWNSGASLRFIVCHQRPFIETFLERYVGITRREYNNYWQKLVFSGKSRAPESYYSPDDVVRAVRKTPGAVGIVPNGTSLLNVKVLSVIGGEQ